MTSEFLRGSMAAHTKQGLRTASSTALAVAISYCHNASGRIDVLLFTCTNLVSSMPRSSTERSICTAALCYLAAGLSNALGFNELC